jgi:hypothetical protein
VTVATGSGRPGWLRMRTRSARSVGSAWFAVSYRPVTWTWRAGGCVQFTALAVRVTEPEMIFSPFAPLAWPARSCHSSSAGRHPPCGADSGYARTRG